MIGIYDANHHHRLFTWGGRRCTATPIIWNELSWVPRKSPKSITRTKIDGMFWNKASNFVRSLKYFKMCLFINCKINKTRNMNIYGISLFIISFVIMLVLLYRMNENVLIKSFIWEILNLFLVSICVICMMIGWLMIFA